MSSWLLFLIVLSTASVALAVDPLFTRGLIAAVATPFTEDGSLNTTVVKIQARYLSDTGVKRVFIGGTTGESLSLSVAERKTLLEEWEKVAGDNGIDYIVHVGAESITDVIELTKHAVDHGAIALGAMPSVFFKPATIGNLGSWMEKIATTAPNLPLYYYHIPSKTGVQFDMLALLKEMESRGVNNFAGVKYTGLYETRAFPDMMRCMAFKNGKYDIMGGREELMVEALAIGATGFIGSQFNYAGDIYNAIYAETDNTKRNDLQLASIELLMTWIDGVPAGVDGNKMMIEIAGVPVGPARMPSRTPTAKEISDLATAVAGWCASYASKFDATPRVCKSVMLRNMEMGKDKK